LIKNSRLTAQTRITMKPSPDLIYSGVAYDLSKGPIRLTVTVPTDTYWSLSCFQQNTDNFFVINDRQITSNPVEILLIKEGMQCPDTGSAKVVFSPSDRGILLIRYLLLSDENYNDLVYVQNQTVLKIGCDP
jgi:uncharacterized membrane protein